MKGTLLTAVGPSGLFAAAAIAVSAFGHPAPASAAPREWDIDYYDRCTSQARLSRVS